MIRLIAPSPIDRSGRVRIEGEEYHHALVMRAHRGEEVQLLDGRGGIYAGAIDEITRGALYVAVDSFEKHERRGEIVLYQGLAKSDKFELILQKACELGVSAVAPFISSRTVVKVKSDGRKMERWRRIVANACKQCGQPFFPEIRRPTTMEQILSQAREQLRLVAWEEAESGSIRELIGSVNPYSVGVMIGPEGGLSHDEIARAVDLGFHCVTLGRLILRAETAAIVAISIVQYELGNLG